MSKRVVVVTGASAGIGEKLCELLGSRGDAVVGVARREALLSAVMSRSGPDALGVVGDVTVRADHARVVEAALAKFGRIDAWVNNAGRGITRMPSQLTDADLDEMVLVNVKSALYGIQAVLPHFQARGTGHVVNVSSMLGRVPFAHPRAAYSASKHMLNALTANLRGELRASHPGIHVSLVSPGVVATDFGNNALHGGMDSRAFPDAQPAEEVAAVIADVLDHPKSDVYSRPGMRERAAAYYAAEDMDVVERAWGGPPRR